MHSLLTLVLIVASIFVYDLVRGDAGGASVATRERQAPAEREHDPAKALVPTLGDHGLGTRLRRVEERLSSVESQIPTLRQPAETLDPPPLQPDALPGLVLKAGPGAGQRVFEEEALTTLHAYLEEIERRRVRAHRSRQLGDSLGRRLPGLSPDERLKIITATLEYEDAKRQTVTDLGYRGNDPEDPDPHAVQAVLETLYEEYRVRLGEQFGAGTVSRILETGLVTDPSRAAREGR